MKIVAFLQNQWFHDPVRAKKIMEMSGRERFIKDMLFFRCMTGKRLRACLGEELVDMIVWEEVSTEIGGKASSVFAADHDHIADVLTRHEPTHVIALGARAGAALAIIKQRGVAWELLIGPHPVARQAGVGDRLRAIRDELYAAQVEKAA